MPATSQAAATAAFQRRPPSRRIWATLRDTWVLIREFRDGLILFTLFLLVGAVSFRLLWNLTYAQPMRLIEAFFHITTMTFLQPTLDFPREWYLDIYFFLMPLLGIIALARGAADFGVLLFNRKSRQAQWEEAVASTFSNHIIVAGLGHLGIRVVRELVVLGEEIVVIEQNASSTRFSEVHAYDIPIIVGDARDIEVLKRAGLERASALIICTNNDLVNIQIASRVRDVNKTIRLVMRLFDDEFAEPLAERFDIVAAMSSSGMAAPAFAGAAAGTEIIQTFKVANQVLTLGRIEVQPRTPLEGCLVRTVEQELDLSIVLLQADGKVDVHPPRDYVLKAGDVIAVVAQLPQIKALATRWNRPNRR